MFESVLRRCLSEGLVGGEGFAIDASVIKADANRTRGVPGSETTDWHKDAGTSRAVREYLDALEEVNSTSDGDDEEPSQPPAPGKNVSLTDPAASWTAAPHRKITRNVHERSRDVARELANTPQYQQSRRDRKKVEILFAHLKRILKLDRLRLRGLTGAHDEFLLAAIAQNLRRMAKRLFEVQRSTAAIPT